MNDFEKYLDAAGKLELNAKQRAFHEAEATAWRAQPAVSGTPSTQEAFGTTIAQSLALWIDLTEDERAPFRKLALDMLAI